MQQLPMGLCSSPDIFQEKMSELFDGLEFVRTYINDLLCLTKGSFKDHLEKLERVLLRLQEAGLKVNGNKLFFAKTKLEYLGYWITCDGIKPLPDKVKAILAIDAPQNRKELHSFIGIINYYSDIWVRRSHVLALLASLTSNKSQVQLGTTARSRFPDCQENHRQASDVGLSGFQQTVRNSHGHQPLPTRSGYLPARETHSILQSQAEPSSDTQHDD
jgi:Reverse transcriptase (RNA-dependent DNA polymerase)